MTDELKWVLGGLVLIAVVMVFTGHLKGNVQFQSVIGVDCPAFKTNAVGGVYGSSTWIAVDCNEDNIFEKYGYDASAPLGWIWSTTGTAPNGMVYMCKTAGVPAYRYVAVKQSSAMTYIAFRENYGNAATADTTCVPSCTPNCVGKCGGVSDGCSGTCNAACTYTYSCIDNNPVNNKVDKSELLNILQIYINGG